MTRYEEMTLWMDRLPPGEKDEIAERVLWELQAAAEH